MAGLANLFADHVNNSIKCLCMTCKSESRSFARLCLQPFDLDALALIGTFGGELNHVGDIEWLPNHRIHAPDIDIANDSGARSGHHDRALQKRGPSHLQLGEKVDPA